MDTANRIVYIAGYGRSGSTILDIVLGNHPDIVGAGEISLFLNELTGPERRCSCNQIYNRCDFWEKFIKEHSDFKSLKGLIRKIEKFSFLPRLLLGLVSKPDREKYRSYHAHLFDYICARSGKRIIVDSSKSARYTTGRFFALSRIAGLDVRVVHLVRNGWAVMNSLLVTGSNRVLEGSLQPGGCKSLRAAVGWINANIWSSILGKLLGSSRYLKIHYENFINDPVKVLKEISGLSDFDVEILASRIQNGEVFKTGHMIGGNRIRFQDEIKIEKYENKKYGKELKIQQKLIFVLTAWWMNRLLGYRGPYSGWPL